MPRDSELRQLSIVLLGDFNPKIFQPAWFGAQNLIRPTEADEAVLRIAHPDLLEFSLDWLVLQVTRERFWVDTSQDTYFPTLRDLVLGTFEILRHTPLTKMGINVTTHIRLDSEKDWHKFGDALAPKNVWSGVLDTPGMISLTMQGNRPDEYKGNIHVAAEPSRRVPNGVNLRVNDHFELPDVPSTAPESAGPIIAILKDSWEASIRRSDDIVDRLMKNCGR